MAGKRKVRERALARIPGAWPHPQPPALIQTGAVTVPRVWAPRTLWCPSGSQAKHSRFPMSGDAPRAHTQFHTVRL